MRAFVEILSGVVRAGEEATHYGRPFESAIAFSSTDGRTAVLKGLSRPMPPPSHYKAAKAALAKLGLVTTRERVKEATS